MILVLDAGNSCLTAGIFQEHRNTPLYRTSLSNQVVYRPDRTPEDMRELLEQHFRQQNTDLKQIRHTALCSVLKDETVLLAKACSLLTGTPCHIVDPSQSGKLVNGYDSPEKTGPDRIASALGGMELFPSRNLIIADFGTATTIDAVTREGRFLGGTIYPGMGMAAKSLRTNTAVLPEIELRRPRSVLGKNTERGILSGVYYGQIGAAKEIIRRMGKECFGDAPYLTVATGGFTPLLEGQTIFQHTELDLVLIGTFVFQREARAHR